MKDIINDIEFDELIVLLPTLFLGAMFIANV